MTEDVLDGMELMKPRNETELARLEMFELDEKTIHDQEWSDRCF